MNKLLLLIIPLMLTLGLTGCVMGNTPNPANQISVATEAMLTTDIQNATLVVLTSSANKDPNQVINTTVQNGQVSGYNLPLITSDRDTIMVVEGTFKEYSITLTHLAYSGSIIYSSSTGSYVNTLEKLPASPQ